MLSQLLDYLASTEQHEPRQSAYRPIHSTETALVRVVHDIQMALDQKNAAMLVLLDLSAAFDSIDHSLMLIRLSKIGIVETAHKWFSSYLRGREQSVFINGTASQSVPLKYGVPEGSVLGPVFFTQYTIGAICRRHGVSYQLYADDTQIYITFRIDDLEDQHAARLKIEACIAEIRAWMIIHRLKLNDDKTEYIFTVSANNSSKITAQPIRIGEATITPTPSARNIGVMVDDMLTMADHIQKVCQMCHLWLGNIRRIRPSLTVESTHQLVQSLVVSRLDYCNYVLPGFPKGQIAKLQRVQNSVARLITCPL